MAGKLPALTCAQLYADSSSDAGRKSDHRMKLQRLSSSLGTMPGRLATLGRIDATPRLRGARATERRSKWLRMHPLCVKCQEAGRVTAATVPDHIVPLADGGADDESNLQSLCDPCHAVKTAAENRARMDSDRRL